MRTGLFLAGIFGGFSFRNTQFVNNNNSQEVAEAAGLTPRSAQEIEHFRDVGWYKGRRRPFSAKYRNYLLGDIIPLTHDTALFRFLLPEEDDEFHLKPCSTLQARVTYSGGGNDTVQRMYTPVTPNGTKGYFDIIVKRKQKGRMTSHLFGMRVGDVMQFRNVLFKLNYRANRWDEVGMIAGGTGFTPMLQVIHHALKPVDDPYEIKERQEKAAQDKILMEKKAVVAESAESGENATKLVFQQPQAPEVVPVPVPTTAVVATEQKQEEQVPVPVENVNETATTTTTASTEPIVAVLVPSVDSPPATPPVVEAAPVPQEQEQKTKQEEPTTTPPASKNPDQIVINGDEVVNPIVPRTVPKSHVVAKEVVKPSQLKLQTQQTVAAPSSSSSSSESKTPEKKKTQQQQPMHEIDRTKLSFLFCNRSENHILLKTLFEKLAAENPDRFRVKFCVDAPLRPETWDGYTGYVTPQMIRETMPPPDRKRSIILLCGPDHLLHRVAGTAYYALKELSGGRDLQPAAADLANLTSVGGILGEMGYTSDNVYKF